MNICGYIPESVNEGIGLRAVIFISGCKHKCPGCHNQSSWDFDYGTEFTEEEQLRIIDEIKENQLLDGVTICGGDPFFSSKEVVLFLKKLKEHVPNINIWTYTGFKYEDIIRLNRKDMMELLLETDVLIDGKYIEELRDLTLAFRGSKNQKVIDVKRSLMENKIIELNV
ncbi:Pyruvate formate-lyase 1-activating enzyme [compost metagenome]